MPLRSLRALGPTAFMPRLSLSSSEGIVALHGTPLYRHWILSSTSTPCARKKVAKAASASTCTLSFPPYPHPLATHLLILKDKLGVGILLASYIPFFMLGPQRTSVPPTQWHCCIIYTLTDAPLKYGLLSVRKHAEHGEEATADSLLSGACYAGGTANGCTSYSHQATRPSAAASHLRLRAAPQPGPPHPNPDSSPLPGLTRLLL